ncbi:TPA: hypothetical protein QCU24_002709 [Bacillus cereus]|uniref:Uncharacterized protein n=1 Tax=Bacillus thuringiensis subsp. darmstadiensis TaxID=132264 RepID=A0A9X6J0B0_BACUD|nr:MULTISPECIES: hypothetical protein [Bacillus cereus group]MRC28773.1 hypothetical protein [Bacillus thuringiensis]ANC17676.1 hypothetical protein WR52_02420 [Bacillus cereus]MBM6770736.1 hypothetical protein [Bacillus cereus]MDA2477586.1 hypothetical protein [Bacillus cereus]MDA2495972.1 hypothetical protein [Bacillus cereus]
MMAIEKEMFYRSNKKSVQHVYTFLFCYKNYNRLGDKSITALQWVLFLYYKIGLVYKDTKKIQLRKELILKTFK